ncbi:MAG: DUF1844 domain-containing protein [Candidatus Rokuibacteriota bacterium]
MSEGEGRFRERRSAHATEEELRPAPAAEAPPIQEEGDDPGREPGVVIAAAAEAPAPSATPPESPPADTAPGRKVPEAPFFDVVQYIVLRASQCLGEIPLDETGERRVLPREGKQYIDLLSMLRDLLRNELSPEAARALDGVLTDLRTRYLELT